MKIGIYVLRVDPTIERPYVIAIIIAGPYERLAISEKALLEGFTMAGVGEIRLRRWDGRIGERSHRRADNFGVAFTIF